MKIIVLGDAFKDIYHIGTTHRVSPEAPIPVVEIQSTQAFLGGALNVRENLKALGEDGLFLFKAPQEVQNYPIKNRLICDGVQIARWDEKDYCWSYRKGDLFPLIDADAIVVSDYGKGSISEEVIQVLREFRGQVFVDTKGDPGPWVGSKAILFPNLKEWGQWEGKYEWFPQVVLKCGAEGLRWVEYGKVTLSRPAVAQFVKSVNGAGDTVMAGFVSSFLAGANLDYCLEFANAAAAVVVEKPYTSVAKREEVLERMLKEKAKTFLDE